MSDLKWPVEFDDSDGNPRKFHLSNVADSWVGPDEEDGSPFEYFLYRTVNGNWIKRYTDRGAEVHSPVALSHPEVMEWFKGNRISAPADIQSEYAARHIVGTERVTNAVGLSAQQARRDRLVTLFASIRRYQKCGPENGSFRLGAFNFEPLGELSKTAQSIIKKLWKQMDAVPLDPPDCPIISRKGIHDFATYQEVNSWLLREFDNALRVAMKLCRNGIPDETFEEDGWKIARLSELLESMAAACESFPSSAQREPVLPSTLLPLRDIEVTCAYLASQSDQWHLLPVG